MHGAFTELYSAFWLGDRTLDSMREFGILPRFRGVAVSDRYQNYFHAGWQHIAGHQACCAHLVRDFQDGAETYPDAIWPVQAQRALRGLIKAWHDARDAGLPAIPASVASRDLLEFCRDREDDVLRFTTDTRIWPTNNLSERGVRPLKTQQKISGRLASDDITQDRLDIRSYLDTARKHGRNVMTILHDLFTGNPWQPPAAAAAT